MKYRTLLILGVALAVAVLLAWYVPFNLLRSPSSIRATLLVSTPIGSNAVLVQSVLSQRGIQGRFQSTGFLKQESGETPKTIGVSSIRAELGHYYLPLRTDVTAFWGFDATGALIDIWVWKTVDAP
ncbi:MAG: hypothetical protein WB870_14930 [Gallionellaceae bacterium]